MSDFFDNDVRCEKLIPIHLCLTDTPSSMLVDAVQEYQEVCELLELDEKTINEIVSHPYPDLSFLALTNKNGFLAQFSTPVIKFFSENGFQTSWGHYKTKWFYSDDYNLLPDMALRWQRDYYKEQKSKYLNEVSNAP